MPLGRWEYWDVLIHEGCDFWDLLDNVEESRISAIRVKKQDQRIAKRKQFYMDRLIKKRLGESDE